MIKPDQDPVAHVRHLPIAEQLKYCAARYAYKRAGLACPRKFDGVTVTWAMWFVLVFKQPLDEYVRECQQRFSKHPHTPAA